MNETLFDVANSFRIVGTLGSHFAHLTHVSISPDGRFLSSADQNGVLVIRAAGGLFPRIRYYKATTAIRSITWMGAVPSALLVGCGNGDVHILILRETTTDYKRLEILNGSISCITTSDRGSLVAMAVGDDIILADQDPHALEQPWSNIRCIKPPSVTLQGEIPLIRNLHILGEDVIIVSHFETTFGIRAVSVIPPYKELWRIPLRKGTYIGYSAISPSKEKMVVTNTTNGLDIYSLKRQRYSSSVEYGIHRDRRIFGVAFLDENNIVAADEGNLVFAEVGQQEPEIKNILEGPDRDQVLQLMSVGHIQDKLYIFATHNLLSREPRGERYITVARQVSREKNINVAKTGSGSSINANVIQTNFTAPVSSPQQEGAPDNQDSTSQKSRGSTALEPRLLGLEAPVTIGRIEAAENPAAPINADIPGLGPNNNLEMPRLHESPSSMVRAWMIVIPVAIGLLLWGTRVNTSVHYSVVGDHDWTKRATHVTEFTGSSSTFSETPILIDPALNMGTDHSAGRDQRYIGPHIETPSILEEYLRVEPVTTTQTRIETQVLTLTNTAISTVTETLVIERFHGARTSWSNSSIIFSICLGTFGTAVVVTIFLRRNQAQTVSFDLSAWANGLTNALKDLGAGGLGVGHGETPSGVRSGKGLGVDVSSRSTTGLEALHEARTGDVDGGAPAGTILEEPQMGQVGNRAGGGTYEGVPLVGTPEVEGES